MTYGRRLVEVAEVLETVTQMLSTAPPPSAHDQLAVAVARTRLYRALERQAVLVAGTGRPAMVASIRAATANTTRDLPPSPPPVGPVALAFDRATRAAEAAAEILEAAFASADSGPAPPQASSTSAAELLQDQGERRAALAAVARLAMGAAVLDASLGAWLTGQWVVATAIADATDTPRRDLVRNAAYLVERGRQRSILETLEAAPAAAPLDPSAMRRSARTAIESFDTARAWLLNHHAVLTAADLSIISRTSVALVHQLSRLLQLLGTPLPEGAAQALTAGWRNAAAAMQQIRDPAPTNPGSGVLALHEAERWLQRQLRDGTGWRRPEQLFHRQESRGAWRSILQEFTSRLPDLAALTALGTTEAFARNALLHNVPERRRRTEGGLTATPNWVPAQTTTGPGAQLWKAVVSLTAISEWPARIAGAQPKRGLERRAYADRAKELLLATGLRLDRPLTVELGVVDQAVQAFADAYRQRDARSSGPASQQTGQRNRTVRGAPPATDLHGPVDVAITDVHVQPDLDL